MTHAGDGFSDRLADVYGDGLAEDIAAGILSVVASSVRGFASGDYGSIGRRALGSKFVEDALREELEKWVAMPSDYHSPKTTAAEMMNALNTLL